MTDTPESFEALRKFVLKAKSDDPFSPAWNIMDHLMRRGDTLKSENAMLRKIVERAEKALTEADGHSGKFSVSAILGDALADIAEMKKEIEG